MTRQSHEPPRAHHTVEERVAALVLGAAVWPGELPSPTLDRRARKGAALWREGHVHLVIGCGGVGHHPPSEAEMIRRICETEGVPGPALRCEEASTSTYQNIAFALPILREEGVARIVIVTDAYHAPRAALVAHRFGLSYRTATPVPSGTQGWKRLRSALREVPAFLYYLIRPGGPG
ncbi:YdcF family protein [Tropicimonas aquimaris]|uniref:YdcF family protein n=1 Tax=Tropicimonas aquimaris TaxID=914152 RepID=A0ABW3IIY3_9RHOB